MNDSLTTRLATAEFSCLYDPGTFDERQAKALLDDNATRLLANGEAIFQSCNGLSYRIEIAGTPLFAKEITHRSAYRHWLDRLLTPASFQHFRSAERLIEASLPTPRPVLAGYIKACRRPRQFIVTEFCEQALGLGEFARQTADAERLAFLADVVALLISFHCKGFYSRHLRAANILVQPPLKRGGTHRFWFIDLDRLGSTRFMPASVYISTVTRACAEFFDDLSNDERTFLLRTAFDAALKANIYSRPSQQGRFIKKAIAMIRARK